MNVNDAKLKVNEIETHIVYCTTTIFCKSFKHSIIHSCNQALIRD